MILAVLCGQSKLIRMPALVEIESWHWGVAGKIEGGQSRSSALFFFLQVTFCDPVIERRPRLQRQRRIFSKRRGMCGGDCVRRGPG